MPVNPATKGLSVRYDKPPVVKDNSQNIAAVQQAMLNYAAQMQQQQIAQQKLQQNAEASQLRAFAGQPDLTVFPAGTAVPEGVNVVGQTTYQGENYPIAYTPQRRAGSLTDNRRMDVASARTELLSSGGLTYGTSFGERETRSIADEAQALGTTSNTMALISLISKRNLSAGDFTDLIEKVAKDNGEEVPSWVYDQPKYFTEGKKTAVDFSKKPAAPSFRKDTIKVRDLAPVKMRYQTIINSEKAKGTDVRQIKKWIAEALKKEGIDLDINGFSY